MSEESGPVAAYVTELVSTLPVSGTSHDIIREVRDHLLTTAAAAQNEGLDRIAAEQHAVQEFGPRNELIADFRAVVVATDMRRQARRQVGVAVLLAVCGISVFRFIPIWRGQLSEMLPAPPIAFIAGATVLGPSLALLRLSYLPGVYAEHRWRAWLDRASGTTRVLFIVGLTVCAGLVVDQIVQLGGVPHNSLVVGAVSGLVFAAHVIPLATQRSRAHAGQEGDVA